ncbi:MAG: hypothetical protein NWE89_03880 [Candidatus Bathyarchaeota archaeon]|nr:hypothetical protein [Candidatus Bathyarchaeota archaeon]
MRTSQRKIIILLAFLIGALSQTYTLVYFGFYSEAKTTIAGSPVILEHGTSGTSIVYPNATSATSQVDSHSTTFYPNDYNITQGMYASGTTPDNVMDADNTYFDVDSTGSDTTALAYYPSSYNMLGNTSLIGGSIVNLTNNDGVYITFKSYRSNLNYTDYVNNNSGNVDSKPDVGTHSNFSAQQSGPDSVYDTLTETQVIEDVGLDFIDNNSSDVDTSVSIGSHSNFENEKAVDSTYNVLTEENVPVSEWLDCNSFDNTWSDWYENGTSPYLNAQDQPTNIIYEKSGGQEEGWFGFENTGLVGSLNLNLSIYCRNIDGLNDDADVYVDYTGSGVGTFVAHVGAHTNWQYDTINLGAHNVSEVNNLRVYFVIHNIGAANQIYIDHARLGVRGVNQRLDLENQFTSVSTSYDVTELCIKTGTTGTEDLSLSIWNSTSSSWGILTTDLPGSEWTNHTITDYVTSAITIRFLDGTKTLDITQDNWSIDAVLLRQHNLTYQLDLEVQWTALNYTRANEYIGIYGGTMGAEETLVDVWYNSTWNNLFTDLVTGWNNASISQYLDSSTFTIRFRDATTAKDRSQDTWQIDASVLRTWNDEYTSEVELEGTSNLYEWTQMEWTIDSSWSNESITVDLQLFNFTGASYQSSGQGYLKYTSGVGNTDETKILQITSDPEDFRNATGWWRVKILGVKKISYKFLMNVDLSRIDTTYYNEYTAETEFIFTDVTDNQSPNLNFTVVTHNSIDGATVTLQVYNYTSSSYPTSSQGYLTYVSTGFNITSRFNITNNAQSCLSSSYTRVRVTSVLSTTLSYQQQTNLVRLLQEESQRLHDYALRVTNTAVDPYSVRLVHLGNADIHRLINCTICMSSDCTHIQVLDGSVTQTQGAWVSLGGFSSLDILISASSITREPKSSIYSEVEVVKDGTSTYTKLPVLFLIY